MPRAKYPQPLWLVAPALGLCSLIAGATARGQEAPLPIPPPGAEAAPAAVEPPALPSEAPAAAPAATTTREAELEGRIQQLEAMVNRLQGQVTTLATRPSASPAPAGARGSSTATPAPGTAGGSSAAGANTPNTSGSSGGSTGAGASSGQRTLGGAPGQSIPAAPAPRRDINMPAVVRNLPTETRFGPGFDFRTADDEYVWQFHNLTQIDGRFYQQGGQTPVHDTFGLPRQWFMFSGRITKPIEYFVSFQNGFDAFGLLDAFLNINYDERLQFRVGRWKTPLTYEFWYEPIQGLTTPERSLYFNNFALNRQVGAQVWGALFQKRIDYAAAILNQTPNGVIDNSDGKDVVGFLNFRPFLLDEGNPFQFFHFGGSALYGDFGSNPPVPTTLRTAVPTTGNPVIGVPFLTFNNNAREIGPHANWTAHVAWYRRQLTVISEYQAAFQDYALTQDLGNRVHLPIQSWYIKAGYFITGETVSGRNVPEPIRPFDIRKGKLGPGAIELFSRYNYLNLGHQVFTSGLADQNLYTNQLSTIDVGFNWYWTQYSKFVFQWEHAMFGNPVLYAPGRFQLTSDMFLARFQLYF